MDKETLLKKRCDILLKAMLGNEELCERWWFSRNKAFSMQKPQDCDIVDVYNYLMYCGFGH